MSLSLLFHFQSICVYESKFVCPYMAEKSFFGLFFIQVRLTRYCRYCKHSEKYKLAFEKLRDKPRYVCLANFEAELG